jgi:acyl carrier protein
VQSTLQPSVALAPANEKEALLPDETTVRESVRALIVEMAPVKPAKVSSSSELSVDLGYDSLALMELAALIEERFELQEIAEDDAAEADTVGEVEDLVVRSLESRETEHAL